MSEVENKEAQKAELKTDINNYVENDVVQLIIFTMGKEEYGVPITTVQEIIMMQEPTKMPQTPDSVEGVINLRGKIIPIIDGKKKFNLSKDESKDVNDERIMIIDVDHEVIGLVVDEVHEVVHLPVNEIDQAPVDTNTDNNFLWGVGKYQNRLLILLNPCEFLNSHEVTDLQGFANVTRLAQNV